MAKQVGLAWFGWYGFRTKRLICREEEHNTAKPLNVKELFRGLTEDTTVSGMKSCATTRGLISVEYHLNIKSYHCQCIIVRRHLEECNTTVLKLQLNLNSEQRIICVKFPPNLCFYKIIMLPDGFTELVVAAIVRSTISGRVYPSYNYIPIIEGSGV